MNWYSYVGGNPVSFNDPDGEVANFVIGALIGGGLDYAFQVGGNLAAGQSFSDSIVNVDLVSIAISTGTGALTGGIGGALSKQGAKTAGQFAYNAGVNGLANATVGAGSQALRNSVNGDNLSDNVAQSFTLSFITGGAGSIAGDSLQAGLSATRNLANSAALSNSSKLTKYLAISGTIETSARGISFSASIATAGTITSASISNYPIK